MKRNWVTSVVGLWMVLGSVGVAAPPLVYEGSDGPGAGKHLVFLAGDHEYRSEESLPALARILAKHHGFRCTVLFTVDPKTEEIVPGCNHMPGIEALDTADLALVFLRFQNFPDAQMKHFESYINRGGPIIGFRTSTHAFKIPHDAKYGKYDYRYAAAEFKNGFGRQILGETWAGHHGKNHVMSTRLDIVPAAKNHPILRGVTKPWAQAGAYWTDPTPDSQILAMAQALQGMTPDAKPAEGKAACPGVWVRSYKGRDGKTGRVFSTTCGASEDLLDDHFRRMIVNACFWAAGMEDKIRSNLEIAFVGPYLPATYRMGGYRKHVKPSDLAGWESPIMPQDKPITPPKKRKKNNNKK